MPNHLEIEARRNGFSLVAGGDEAGRGPWAGPVFAAMVILPEAYDLPGLDDSKKLSRADRRRLFQQIQTQAMAFGIGTATPEEIDQINILQATRQAFRRAFDQFSPHPDYVLLDFIKLPWLQVPHQAFPRGESLSDSIAAASILAKEARDLFMEQMDLEYPGYGFAAHMGYGTPAHQSALKQKGPCAIHRRSFKPIKALCELPAMEQGDLFDSPPTCKASTKPRSNP